jgi:hypothetical protein
MRKVPGDPEGSRRVSYWTIHLHCRILVRLCCQIRWKGFHLVFHHRRDDGMQHSIQRRQMVLVSCLVNAALHEAFPEGRGPIG